MMHEPKNTYSKLNSNDTHLIGYLVANGDIYIGHFVLRVIHVSTIVWRALRSLAKHLEILFQVPFVYCSCETFTLQRL
jgi:hypothetical protein